MINMKHTALHNLIISPMIAHKLYNIILADKSSPKVNSLGNVADHVSKAVNDDDSYTCNLSFL